MVVQFRWKNVLMDQSILIHGMKPVVWLGGQGLGRSVIRKLVGKTVEGEVYRWTAPCEQRR